MTNKVAELSAFLSFNKYEIVGISEHWMDVDQIKLVNLPEYKLSSYFCRDTNKHGGVALYVSSRYFEDFISVDMNGYSIEFQAEYCGIYNKYTQTLLITVYRPCNGDFGVFLQSFEILLGDMSGKHRNIIILGDFNVDFLKYSLHLESLVCVISSYGIQATISDFTRVSGTSRSCIDNILTNLNDDLYNTSVIDPCLSDHYGQVISFGSHSMAGASRPVHQRPITQRGLHRLKTAVAQTDWHSFYSSNCACLLSSFLTNTFSVLVNECFPIKVKQPRHQGQFVEWFGPDLAELRDVLRAVKVVADHRGDEDSKNVYREVHRRYKNKIQQSKRDAYDNFIRNSNKIKDSWRLVNFERNKCETKVSKNITNTEFNDFFVSIAENIVTALPTFDHDLIIDNTPAISKSFFISPITDDDISDAIHSLKNSSSVDVYGLNSKMVKHLRNDLARPLAHLFNTCISEGVFPEELKVSRVVPVFKKENVDDVNNYRPISIIPIFGKIFEAILKPKICNFLEKNNLLNPNQFGFRAGMSASGAVLRLVDGIVEGFEEGRHAAVTLCDLSKAFDCVDHQRLLTKLESFFGFRGIGFSLLTFGTGANV